MATDTISLNEKHFPEIPQTELNFLNPEDNEKEEAQCEAAAAAPRPKTVPGRRPLFRN